MDRATLLAHYEEAQALVIDGELRIARHKALIHNLNRDGPSGINAEEYLHFLEGTQALHVKYRDQLERELHMANPE